MCVEKPRPSHCIFLMGAFAERLAETVRQYGPLCVGLDPRWECLPADLRRFSTDGPLLFQASQQVRQFCLRVLELTRPYSGVVKFQSAFFELLGPAGMQVMQELIQTARQQGWLIIWDAKRGDVASTAEAYAAAALTGWTLNGQTLPVWNADALTVNPYLGADALEPFLAAARRVGRGVFVLVRTSNPGAGLFQDLICEGRPLYSHVAEAVARWNAPTVSASGLGDVGAVAGATHPRQLAELRQSYPHLWLLVPGYGAQGGTAEEIRQAAFRDDGLGAIVNSSRGVVFPFHPHDPDWERAIRTAAEQAQRELTGR